MATGGGTISLPVEALVRSECMSRINLSLERGPSFAEPDFSGPSEHDGSSSQRKQLSNAVVISLLVVKEFVRCYKDRSPKCDLASLHLKDFVVKLQRLLSAEEIDGEGRSNPNDEGDSSPISSVAEVNAALSSGPSAWILLDANIQCKGEPHVNAIDDISPFIQKLGQLIHAIFTQNENDLRLYCQAEQPDKQASNWDRRGAEVETPKLPDGELSQNVRRDKGDGTEAVQPSSKLRRSGDRHLFDRLLESGYPTSVCRLVGDLIDRSNSRHPIISFDDVVHDLEQMHSNPQVFLINPEDDFTKSTPHFGQRYYGRSKELTKLLEITTVPNQEDTCLEAVFVSGIAGSGKTHLVSTVGQFASKFGVMVLMAKFNRGLEYESRDIASSLFDGLVSNLVEMKYGGSETDIEYSQRASYAIEHALGGDGLASLVDFVPSIRRLIPGIARHTSSCAHWQLIYSLSKLVGAVLSLGRKVMLCFDDLQWCDATTMEILSEVVSSTCNNREQRGHLVFVGLYRADEVTGDIESFTRSFMGIEMKDKAKMTDIKLSTFSVDDVVELTMNELRLPRRLVVELADVTHKRSHGSPMFVIQFLNSLVSDSTIAYSPLKHRFEWEEDKVRMVQTPDNVASLIISNLSSLPKDLLQCLRIISCFGNHVHSNLLGILEIFRLAPKGGFDPHIHDLVDQGILEIVSPLVVFFAHDLIQEQVYRGIPSKERQQLHLDIGTFLGSKTSLDATSQGNPIDSAIENLDLNDNKMDNSSDDGDSAIDESTLISIATAQVNNAGPNFFADPNHCQRFACWNLQAGKDAAERSNFRAALYYYKSGVGFLEGCDRLWHDSTFDLSLKLYEGCAFSSSALAETSLVRAYTLEIIAHVQSFDQTLQAQYLAICSFTISKQYQKAIARGLAVLRQLKFDIPSTPTPLVVIQTMNETDREASLYDFSAMDDDQRVDFKTRSTMKIIASISTACYMISSPFLPLVACETIRFSLRNGVCPETISALVLFAYFRTLLDQSFDRAHHWGGIAKRMLEKSTNNVGQGIVLDNQDVPIIRFMLFGYVWFWYIPLPETISRLRSVFDSGLKVGRTDVAYMALCLRLYFSFFRGEHLSIISHSLENHLPAMSKFSSGSSVLSAIQKDMIGRLVGDGSCNPYAVINHLLPSAKLVLADAETNKHHQIVEAVHFNNFATHFWMGDYVEAEKESAMAMSVPSAKMPKIQLVYRTFYRGIVSFHLHRDGKGEEWLAEGEKMLEQVKKWAVNSKETFENKLILLEAEHYASLCHVVAAKESYDLAIKVAKDNGYIHEEGLAHECKGKYLESIIELEDAEHCFMNAYDCFKKWGALAKANKLLEEHDLDESLMCTEIRNLKHELAD